MEHERFGETELMGDPGPEERANEPEGGGHEQAAAASASKRSADSAADRRDHDENDESRDCECHDDFTVTLILDALPEIVCSVVNRGFPDAVRSLACGSQRRRFFRRRRQSTQ